jgi:hypothetical protein
VTLIISWGVEYLDPTPQHGNVDGQHADEEGSYNPSIRPNGAFRR